ncbi:sporulation protein [Bacillus aerolatus]|uniref:Sporulation protein n=1 Tax=Bacillus aerolatus TaxID=2653354 RepID=A0A6I1FR04_9BACI|nr:YhcN/YlaJ family sporulation lipoprotein [Bacillus aerolatus]KAB7706998.1 sporulation protein [Bacillus aerolatus]
MKKAMLAAGFSSFLMLAACNANDQNNLAGGFGDRNDNNNNNNNAMNVNDRYDRDRYDMVNEGNNNGRGGLLTNDRNDDFGYVRQQKSPIQGENVSYRNMHTIDRERTADAISRLSVALPRVNDSSVLVTDQEVLIAYDTNANTNKDHKETAQQVKKTAMSVVPRWYHVYVTDDTNLRREIENIAQINGDMGTARDTINRTIKLMKQNSPQGYTELEKDNTRNDGTRGTDGTTGTPGTNWTTGPNDQGGTTNHTPGNANPNTNN